VPKKSDPARKSVTLRDIASATGVSSYTVSLALRDHPEIAEKTRNRVKREAARLGYRRDPILSVAMARVRARGQSAGAGTIGVVMAGPRIGFEERLGAPEVLAGIREQAEQFGFGIDVFWPDSDFLGNRARLSEIIHHRGLMGLVLVALGATFDAHSGQEPPIEQLMKGLPMATIGRISIETEPHWHIGVDASRMGYEMIRRASQLGYTRPGLVYDPFAYTRFAGTPVDGYRRAQEIFVAPEDQIPEFRWGIGNSEKRFSEWLKQWKPDCLVSTDRSFGQIGRFVPEGCGQAGGWTPEEDGRIAGFEANWHEVGRVSISAIMAALQRHALGLPMVPGQMLLEGVWHDGASLPPKAVSRYKPGSRKPSEMVPLSLEKFANQPLAVVGGWFQRDFLYGIEAGPIRSGGVPFEVAGDKEQGRCLLMRSASVKSVADGQPAPERVAIPVGKKANALYFLHGCGNSVVGEEFACYRIEFSDGSEEVVPLIAKGGVHTAVGDRAPEAANIQDWWVSYEPLRKDGVWPLILTVDGSPNYLRRLYVLEHRWKRSKTIRRIVVGSDSEARSTLALLGVALEK